MSKPITTLEELEAELDRLSTRKAELEIQLKARAESVYQTVTNPAPIIKKCVSDLARDRDFRTDLMSLALGYLTKKASEGFNSGSKANSIIGLVTNFIGRFKK